MKRWILIFLLMAGATTFGQDTQTEVLLIGTFHFHNPGADVVKVNTFDITTVKAQNELENITNKIKDFNPDKIFVEWEHNQQDRLDSLYSMYYQGNYLNYVELRYPKNKFYLQNEIVQLAFRAAKKCDLKKVYAIDYTAQDFPFDSLMSTITNLKHDALKKQIDDAIQQMQTTDNNDREKLGLTELLLKNNQPATREANLGAYITMFNKAGSNTNFVGAYLVSEWYKRNLYMYSLLQKAVEAGDKKVMVLLGTGHIAMFQKFIELDKNFKATELSEVLK